MSIRNYFVDIASAIKEKNENVLTVTPSQMPQAIRDIETGGVDLYTEDEWNALSTEEKHSLGLVAIQQVYSGFERGILVNGADFLDFRWDSIKKIILGGVSDSTLAQVGDIRFKNSGGEYLASQYNNMESSSSATGGFADDNTRALFDNNANTKCISGTSSDKSFQWTHVFANPIDLNNYTTLEIWTANDSTDRDPKSNVYIHFYDTSGIVAELNIGKPNLPSARKTLGYTNNDYQNETIIYKG